jgi:putative phage-type endonuclease
MKIVDPIYYRNIEQGSDEWHALRRGMITASAVGRLITGTCKPANNDTSRTQLLQLLAERITGESDASFYGDDMARGHMLEPLARDIYVEHWAQVQECGFVTADFDGTVIGYSPDGLVGDHGLIEIKSPRQKHHLRSLLSDEVPAEYVPQVQTGLAVTGRRWCDYISYAPGLPLFIHRCLRDEMVIAQLIAASQAAEAELQRLMDIYTAKAAIFPATKPIQPEQEIVF